MSPVRCPYCRATQGRCAATAAGRWVTECCSCGRVVEERQAQTHQLFLLRAHDNPLPVVTPDLLPLSPPPPNHHQHHHHQPQPKESGDDEDDPFHPTGFITAFSTWSLEPSPVFARSASSFAGHLAELERALFDSSSSSSASAAADASGPLVSVDHLRAYLQILDVSSILGLDHDIADHAFQLFRDCSSATCLRNRNVEALATAALVQAIREAQEPRTLQVDKPNVIYKDEATEALQSTWKEISAASNLPQKEIGKYIKILGEALKLSQPINSNSISVHMPRFCTLLQLNKSAQELAAHIGEVVINKCFCTRRNPISISAAAIYLACQLEDKRKTQAEICKVTGLTEVTLRKVYKELLENWDDLLPPNYTPAVPPEKAFPMTTITSGRSSAKADTVEVSHSNVHQEKEKHSEIRKPSRGVDLMETDHQARGREEAVVNKGSSRGRPIASSSSETMDLNREAFLQPQAPFGATASKPSREKEAKGDQGMDIDEAKPLASDSVQKDTKNRSTTRRAGPVPTYSNLWPFNVPSVVSGPSNARSGKRTASDFASRTQGAANQREGDDND